MGLEKSGRIDRGKGVLGSDSAHLRKEKRKSRSGFRSKVCDRLPLCSALRLYISRSKKGKRGKALERALGKRGGRTSKNPRNRRHDAAGERQRCETKGSTQKTQRRGPDIVRGSCSYYSSVAEIVEKKSCKGSLLNKGESAKGRRHTEALM